MDLKREIQKLKQELEADDRNMQPVIMPSPLTRLKCNREYLAMAEKAYEEAGGKYEPTKEELRDRDFNAALASMKRFIIEIGGFFSGYAKYIYTISGDAVFFDMEHTLYLKPSNLPVYEPFTREEFLQGIADLHIGEWKERYDNPCVLDGTQWNIRIEYKDGRKPVHIYGSNAYPYNFDDLLWFLGLDNADGEDEDEDGESEDCQADQ